MFKDLKVTVVMVALALMLVAGLFVVSVQHSGGVIGWEGSAEIATGGLGSNDGSGDSCSDERAEECESGGEDGDGGHDGDCDEAACGFVGPERG